MEDKILDLIKKANKLNDLEDIFVDVYNEFVDYKMSLDDFSYYCGQLNSRYSDLKIRDQGDFDSVTDEGLELDWFIRQITEGERIGRMFNNIHDYAIKLAKKKGVKINNEEMKYDDTKSGN